MEINKRIDQLTLISIWSVALFSYVSLSASALSHIAIFIPGIYYFHKYVKEKKIHLSKSSISLLCVILFSIISILFAPDLTNKIKQIFKLKYLVFGLLAIIPYRVFFKNVKQNTIRNLLNVFYILLIVGNIAGFHALYSGHHILRMKAASDITRAAGMYGMAITYGYGIGLISILLVAKLFVLRERISILSNKYLYFFALITSLLGLYFSFTRGALLGFIAAVPFLFYKKDKKVFKGLIILGLVGLITVVSLIWNGGDTGNRFLIGAKTTSNMIRVSQYEAAIKGFIEKPLTGWGYRNFESNAYDIKNRNGIDFADFYGHAHNNYLEYLAATGLFGFISFCLFVFFWFREMSKRSDDLGSILLPFVVAFAVSGFFQNTFNDGENMFTIMFIYSLSQCFNRDVNLSATS